MEKAEIAKVIRSWALVFCIFFSFIGTAAFYALCINGFTRLVVGSLLGSSFLAISCFLLALLANDAHNIYLKIKQAGSSFLDI